MASGKHKNRWLSGQVLGLVRKAEFNSVTQHSVPQRDLSGFWGNTSGQTWLLWESGSTRDFGLL